MPFTTGVMEEDGSYRVTIVRQLGGSTASSVGTDRSGTVGTSSATLIPANAARTRFFIKNDSANDIWINFGGTATAAAGSGNLKIAANGGYYEYSGYTGAVNAIAGTASAVTAREFS